jgi:phosphosulfolactate synthase
VAIPAHRKGVSTFFPGEPPVPTRPRKTGMTHVLDRLDPLSEEWLRPLARYIDVVKIGWGLPLLLPREVVRKRIRFYHELGVEVSTGGTLLEYAVARDRASAAISEAKELGFDIVEVSDGVIEMASTQIAKLAEEVKSHHLGVFIEV